MELDRIDQLAAEVLDGYLVRKDLVRTFSRQFPVPTYVVEFMLGRYCASTDEEEIEEGLRIVDRQLKSRTVKAGEEELFKAHAKEKGTVKIIDLISAKLDARNDAYVAYLPSLQLGDIRISGVDVNNNERMLTGGFYAEVTLSYDPAVSQGSIHRPFSIKSLREIQLSSRNVLDTLAKARAEFSSDDWKTFLLRSIGFKSQGFTERQINAHFLRMVPFVERNYNLVELGPRGTGKSHLFQQVSPYARLISGGKATVAQMFVNNASGRRGLVCQYDVVCFDEVSGIKFDQKDGVNIMKGYMESGEFSRGKESIRADAGIVLVGNFDVDVEHQMRIGHLFGPLPPEMRNDTAFMDRIHAYLPGWDVPKVHKEMLTDHFGLVSDFLSECWSQLRKQSRISTLQNRVRFGAALSGRDTNAVNKTVSGLLKLLYPDSEQRVSDQDLEWAVRIALESRRRVKEQQKHIGKDEYGNTAFSYEMVGIAPERIVATTELEAWASGQDDSVDQEEQDASQKPNDGHTRTNSGSPPAAEPEEFRSDQIKKASNVTVDDKTAEELVAEGENTRCEFKSTLRVNLHTRQKDKKMELMVLKTIAAFLNTHGGYVVIGVSDKGEALGLENDEFPSEDKMNLHLVNLLRQRLGSQHLVHTDIRVEDIGDKRAMVVKCTPSHLPVYHRDGNTEQFFIRTGAATTELMPSEIQGYLKQRF